MTQVLYASLAGPHTTSDLYTVDPVIGVMTSVGPIGFACSGLAVDPTSGILYGSTSLNSGSNAHSLISIDTATGAGTLLGGFGLGAFTAHDIAFDSTGQLWGLSTGNDLWSIDKTTGAATSVGTLTDSIGGGLDFDASDVLWGVANFPGNIDTIALDGTQTVVTATSDPSHYAHSGKFDGAGLFWASYPGGSGSGSLNLVTIDINTGVVTVVAPFSVPGVGGLAWLGTPSIRANFSGSPRHGGAPLSVNFTDLSTPGPSGPITGWAWTFGDGDTSSVQGPTHIYTAPGHFTVALTVTGTGPDGTSTLTRIAYIVVGGSDFTPSLTPSSINVSPSVHTLVTLNTSVSDGDTETITLSYTGTAGITLSFDTNPITAGGSTVVHVTIPGVIGVGTYTIPIHCVGTDNSHNVTLTVHVFTVAPGFHVAS